MGRKINVEILTVFAKSNRIFLVSKKTKREKIQIQGKNNLSLDESA